MFNQPALIPSCRLCGASGMFFFLYHIQYQTDRLFSTIIGGTLGGVLARPATAFPHIFAGTIFETYPYLLPNVVCAGVVVFGLIVGVLFLQETHEDRKYDQDRGREAGQWLLRKVWRRESDASFDEKAASADEMQSMLDSHSTSSSPTLCSTRTSFSEPTAFSLDKEQPTPTVRQAFTKQVCLNIVCYGILAL
jgi:hypothetical protein